MDAPRGGTSRELEPARLAVLAQRIRTEVAAAEADFESAVQHAIRAGDGLIEAKGLVAHGAWLPWLAENFALSQSTAKNYMALARNRQRVGDLPSIRQAVVLLVEPKPEREQGPEHELDVTTSAVRLAVDVADGRFRYGDAPWVDHEQAERFTTSLEACANLARKWEAASASDGALDSEDLDDHVDAAKKWIAAADAGREVVREVGKALLGLSLETSGPFATVLARSGSAHLVYADHYEPWDDRNGDCWLEVMRSFEALREFGYKAAHHDGEAA